MGSLCADGGGRRWKAGILGTPVSAGRVHIPCLGHWAPSAGPGSDTLPSPDYHLQGRNGCPLCLGSWRSACLLLWADVRHSGQVPGQHPAKSVILNRKQWGKIVASFSETADTWGLLVSMSGMSCSMGPTSLGDKDMSEMRLLGCLQGVGLPEVRGTQGPGPGQCGLGAPASSAPSCPCLSGVGNARDPGNPHDPF